MQNKVQYNKKTFQVIISLVIYIHAYVDSAYFLYTLVLANLILRDDKI